MSSLIWQFLTVLDKLVWHSLDTLFELYSTLLLKITPEMDRIRPAKQPPAAYLSWQLLLQELHVPAGPELPACSLLHPESRAAPEAPLPVCPAAAKRLVR